MDSDSSQELSDDWTLAKRLKYDDPVQFHTLVRMHLSFVLDLNTDDCDSQPEKSKLRSLKWSFVPFTKKIKTTGKSQEGMQLTKDGMSQVYQLIEYLSQDGNVVQEGIFRRTGKLTRQQELKSLLNSGALVDFGESLYSVHDCASVLKTILAELQEPLLTETYFPAYCQIADLCTQKPNDDRLLQALQLLFLLLPSENWKVLRDIMELLHLVASHENENKMSADNLATLFTPHLLCPRKLQPEAFHATSQMLSKVVAFMISAGPELFNIPSSLATDIKMYWERRKRSPENFLNESSAATTVFSFVDRERTAQENTTNPTEAALAQLYAHIQSLPESSKKRRLVKQFNRENGNGTPNNNRARSIGDSIKKHIFNKTVKPARGFCELGQLKKRSCSEEILNSPESKTPKCFQRLKSGKSCDNIEAEQSSSPLNERIVEDIDVPKPKVELEDKPDVSILNSPVPIPEKENSPFFTPCNPSLMKHRKLSETMMTPRSRKPVVAVSASNICHLANLTWGLKDDPSWDQDDSDTGESLAGAFKEYLSSRSVLTASPVDLSFSSRTGDYDPSSEGRLEDLSHDEIPHSPLSESLLYVLDGNLPNESSDSSGYIDGRHRKRGAEVSGFIPNKRFGPEMSGESSGLGTENSKETPHETSL
ncbi:rho GTPase-activating protein 19-like isoform X2 [Macrosteles quadrilineatus]|uniref:rho GTPase-activating protein 19-like isoform X2 n=1 Tax=Macrosteles quadrilineatus TaxID=74068 RepID=UPI0023E19854|nr:rho GTPase-activating protein 19-like isoform X2 [Macrosteles quadrilineatus]